MNIPYYTSQRNLYWAKANWGADGLAPPAIAARVTGMLERTAHLVPPGQQWFILDRKPERWTPIKFEHEVPNALVGRVKEILGSDYPIVYT